MVDVISSIRYCRPLWTGLWYGCVCGLSIPIRAFIDLCEYCGVESEFTQSAIVLSGLLGILVTNHHFEFSVYEWGMLTSGFIMMSNPNIAYQVSVTQGYDEWVIASLLISCLDIYYRYSKLCAKLPELHYTAIANDMPAFFRTRLEAERVRVSILDESQISDKRLADLKRNVVSDSLSCLRSICEG